MSGLEPCLVCAVNCACDSCGGDSVYCKEHRKAATPLPAGSGAMFECTNSGLLLLVPARDAVVRYVIRRGELFAAEDRHGPEEIFWVKLEQAFMLRFQTKAEAERVAKAGDEVMAFIEIV